MKTIKFNTKKRGPKGEGRATLYKPVQLPVELIDDLKLYKDLYGDLLTTDRDEYGNPIPIHVTFEQMLRRWMDNVGRFDKQVQDAFDRVKKYRAENPRPTHYPVDPTKGLVWDLQYQVERDGEEYILKPDKELYFVAEIDGKRVGVEQLINEEWDFMNDAGIEITIEQAKVISKKILNHQKKVDNQAK